MFEMSYWTNIFSHLNILENWEFFQIASNCFQYSCPFSTTMNFVMSKGWFSEDKIELSKVGDDSAIFMSIQPGTPN